MSKFVMKKVKKNIKRNIFFPTESNLENKKNKEKTVMNTKEKIELANEALSNETKNQSFKKVKKDKGLIERTESSITVITEDNKELLKD